MNKLTMKTPDLVQGNVEIIGQLFPNCIKKTEDEEGNIIKKIDFDLLRTELGDKASVEGLEERYRLDWPGKKRSILKANTPTNKTLRPVKEDSVNWESTGNLYIEGDNFEVLKILQESYLGKIKMIYIDPPYNTGNDFIYEDDFAEKTVEYKERTEENEEGFKMIKNTETNGRFHSDWLSMMYERLKVARDILSDDGVILISIDDNELFNLQKICSEIFGESNFIGNVVRKTKSFDRDKSKREFQKLFDYILVYCKSYENLSLNQDISGQKSYPFSDEFGEYKLNPLQNKGPHGFRDVRPKTYYPIYLLENGKIEVEEPNNKEKVKSIFLPEKIGNKDGTRSRQKSKVISDQHRIVLKNDKLFIKIYKEENADLNKYTSKSNLLEDYPNSLGSGCITKLGLQNLFDHPKPVELIKWCLELVTQKDSYVLDFFSGSATTAQACMELNAEDGGDRKFIMIQLPELCDKESETYKAGFNNICEIGKERIRRAGKKIKEETGANIDYGFRVYKVDESCMKDVYYHPSEAKQENLALFTSNIKEDRTSEDLLTQVILNLGLTLDLPTEEKSINGNQVFYVAGNSLVACFDKGININTIEEIAKDQPIKLVFCDSSFKSDEDRLNVENKVKRISPETKISVI